MTERFADEETIKHMAAQDAEIMRMERELAIVLRHDLKEYQIWLDNKNISFPPITFEQWRYEKYEDFMGGQ